MLLSQAGKEVMIKAVIQSIPPYSMSVLNCQSVHVKKLKQ